MALPPRPPLVDEAVHRVIQHDVIQKLHDQTVVNTFQFRVGLTGLANFTLSTYGMQFWNHVAVQWRASVSNELSFHSVITRVVMHPEVPSETWPINPIVLGTLAGEALPSTVACIIRLRSTHGGKRGRGRRYFAGVLETSQLSSQLTPTALTAFTAFAGRLDDVIPDGGNVGTEQTPFVWSRNKPTEIGLAGATVAQTIVDPVLGTQRRRRLGRGV